MHELQPGRLAMSLIRVMVLLFTVAILGGCVADGAYVAPYEEEETMGGGNGGGY